MRRDVVHEDDMSIEELRAQLDTRHVKDVLWKVMAGIEKPAPWTPTGFGRLDNMLDGGLRPNEVMLIAARPSVGKSAFALQLAMHMVTGGTACTVWSLEMPPEQWIRRGMAAASGVPLKKIRRGELAPHDMSGLAEAAQLIYDKPLYFAPTEGDTTPDGFTLQARLETEVRKSKVLLIDYLQLMEPPQAHSREQEVAKHSRNLKLTANRLGVSIIALAQLNRDADGRVPSMKDLRESGSLEQDADIIVFLHRDQEKDTNLLKDTGALLLAKNRDGETGGCRIKFNWRSMAFEEV